MSSIAGAAEARMLQDMVVNTQLPEWRGDTKNLDAQAAVLWGQVMRAVQVSGYNLVAPPGARGASRDWVRDGVRMQRCATSCCLVRSSWPATLPPGKHSFCVKLIYSFGASHVVSSQVAQVGHVGCVTHAIYVT